MKLVSLRSSDSDLSPLYSPAQLSQTSDLTETSMLDGRCSATEQTITQIWKKILGMDRISVNDDFFDLGGD